MKLIKREGEDFVLHIGRRERRLLFEVLKLYPLVPVAHHRVSQTAKQMDEHQTLLEEALAERRQENKRQLVAMLHEEQRFKETDDARRSGTGEVAAFARRDPIDLNAPPRAHCSHHAPMVS